jgi:hypothetical protein
MKEEYKRRGIRAEILWEKTYYNNDFFDTNDTKFGKYGGILFLYRFLIIKNLINNKRKLLIDPLIEEFGGQTKKEKVVSLREKLKGIKEWNLKGKRWEKADFFPSEVNKQLLKFKLKQYVKQIS